MSIDVFPSMLLATLQNPLPLTQGGTGATTAATARTNLGLGTIAVQDANAVAITGGAISIGGHATTGVLDVQSSVVASDIANVYYGARVWPVSPSGAVQTHAVRVEATTGISLAGNVFRGLSVVDQPVMANVIGVESYISAGTNRYNMFAGGTAQNYFAGNVGIVNSAPSYPLDVTGEVRVVGRAGLGGFVLNDSRLELNYAKASANALSIHPTDNDTAGGLAVRFVSVGGTTIGSITTNASATAYNTSSDVRLKHSIAPLTNSLDVIAALNPVSHRWNADDSYAENFLAHELQRVLAYAVTGEPDAVNDDGSVRPQQVDASKIIPRIVGALQELLVRVQTIEQALA